MEEGKTSRKLLVENFTT